MRSVVVGKRHAVLLVPAVGEGLEVGRRETGVTRHRGRRFGDHIFVRYSRGILDRDSLGIADGLRALVGEEAHLVLSRRQPKWESL